MYGHATTNRWLTATLALFLVVQSQSQYSKQFAGPYQIVLKEMAKCGGGDIAQLYDSTKISRVNRSTYVYSANMFFPHDFDDKTQVELVIGVFGNGGWRDNYHQMLLDKICTYIKNLLPQTARDFFKAIGQDDCPFPSGNYSMSKYVIKIKVGIPVLPYNKYRVDGFLKREGKRYACFRMYLDITPKKKT